MRCGLMALVVGLGVAGVACQPFGGPEGAATIPESDGAPGTTAASSPAAPTRAKSVEWVFSARNEAIYLKWTARDGAVSGVVQMARRSTSGGNVKLTSGRLDGAANGSNVVLTTTDQTWSGTVDGHVLVLAVTRPNGTRVELQFVPGSVGDFDAAVAAIRRAVPTTTSPRAPPTTRPPRKTPTTTVAPRPAGPDPGALVAELAVATGRLRELRAVDNAVARVEGALDGMYAAADELYAAIGRGDCAAAEPALGRLDSAAGGVGQAVASVEQAASEIEEQRAVVMEVGARVVALEDPGLNSAITGANDELGRADVAISELRRYAGEVRGAASSTTADAESARDAAC